jgi:ribonucleoside-triphosphate reductase
MENKIEKYFCNDCKKEIKIEGEELKDGKFLKYKNADKEYLIVKCNDCFKKDPSYSPQKCEIFSRIVGYLRPIKQWNPGKVEEYKSRIPFKLNHDK